MSQIRSVTCQSTPDVSPGTFLVSRPALLGIYSKPNGNKLSETVFEVFTKNKRCHNYWFWLLGLLSPSNFCPQLSGRITTVALQLHISTHLLSHHRIIYAVHVKLSNSYSKCKKVLFVKQWNFLSAGHMTLEIVSSCSGLDGRSARHCWCYLLILWGSLVLTSVRAFPALPPTLSPCFSLCLSLSIFWP